MAKELQTALDEIDKAMVEAQTKRDSDPVEPVGEFYDGMAEGLAQASLIVKKLISPNKP